MSNQYRDEEWLRQQYWEEGPTQREIAEKCGVSARAIRKWMKKFDIERREMTGETHPLYGEEREQSVREAISDTLTGKEFDETVSERMSEAHSSSELPSETREKISESLSGLSKSDETRKRMSEARTGDDNPNWRGGEVPRYGPGWTAAHRKARERDEVCQLCGEDGTDELLDVHHITPVRQFRDDPDSDLCDAHTHDNLVLLCRPCHMSVEHGDVDLDSNPGLE